MSKVDSTQIINEIIKLQYKFDTLSNSLAPSWQKTLQAFTPLIAAVIAGVFTFWITWKAFKLNKEKDATIRKEQDLKELQLKKNKIYSEAFGLVDEIVNNIILYNRYRIETNMYGSIITEPFELDTAHMKNFTDLLFTSRELSEKMLKEVRITRTKLVTLIGKISAINSDTKIIKLYQEYSVMPESYEYNNPITFSGIGPIEVIAKKRIELIQISSDFIKNTIGSKLNELLIELKEEIKI